MNGLSRRNFLKGSAVASGGLLTFNSIWGFSRVFGQEMANDDLQTIINLASTAELFATTHYLAAINGAADMGLGEVQVNYLKAGFAAEQDHLELLMSLGATPVVTEFYVPPTLFSDVELFSAITEVAETAFVAAYLAAVRIFSMSAETTPFAVTCAQIACVEETHRALVRQIGGRLANDQSYAQYNAFNVSSVVPTLQPFLDGSGDGFVGPVAPPTADDIAAVRADLEMIGFATGVPFAAMTEMPA
ncbi:MAG: twin-arginine translocation signal domain-containing protein [Chloroflexota bacterium]|nr:twin-arginine translocation signal domain-containing protein [Chloroflexota bacterium]